MTRQFPNSAVISERASPVLISALTDSAICTADFQHRRRTKHRFARFRSPHCSLPFGSTHPATTCFEHRSAQCSRPDHRRPRYRLHALNRAPKLRLLFRPKNFLHQMSNLTWRNFRSQINIHIELLSCVLLSVFLARFRSRGAHDRTEY